MSFGEMLRRIVFVVRRERRLADMEEEMRLHEDLRAQSLRERGVPWEWAADEAKRQFGNRTSFKEAVWNVWSFVSLENAWRDLKFGARVLRSNGGFTTVAVLTLALGIGATTAMFSVIDNVLLEPFPYAQQQRLFSLVIHDLTSSEPGGRSLFPASEFLDYQEQNRVFEGMMGVGISRALWETGGAPESVNAPIVTPNAFEFLGVRPLLGRVPAPSDVRAGAPAVCVMGYSFWKSRFAGDANILGKVLVLDGTPTTVIGVMPPRFVFWSGDVWLPTALRRDGIVLRPPWFYLLGRLREGLKLETADQQIQLLAEHIAQKYRPLLYPSRFDAKLESFADAAVGRFRRTLFLLLAAVGLLLLIACANVANLLLAKVSVRRKEFVIRASLGAGWWRVARQLFLESGLLALMGAALGCAFAWGGLKLLLVVLPRDTFPEEAVIALNVRVLAGTVAVAASTAFFFGLVPMLGGLRQDVNDALKSGGREHSGFRRLQFRNLLVVGEVAISLVLLSAAGVMMRSFLHAREAQLGFNPQHLLTAEVFLNKRNRTVAQQAVYNRELTSALRRVPGVVDVATTTDFLPFGGAATEFEVAGQAHSEQANGQFALIDANLFQTVGVRLVRGRGITETDITGKHMVTVVNQTLAKKFFPNEDPVGKRIHVTTLAHLPEPVADPAFEIVGVVADIKNRGLRQSVLPEAFVPYTLSGLGGFIVVLRAAADPGMLGKTVEGTALALDGSTVVRHIRTMDETLESEEYAKPRFGLEIFSVFAALGVLLVSAGLYSVMAYSVAQRRREMGIRVALGATSGDVQALVIGTGLRFVMAGIGAGLVAAFLALRLIQSQIWGISAHDPATLIVVAGVLVVVGVAACYVPSLAATRVDPAETLRSE
jgi:putative ABC transport system permease protein